MRARADEALSAYICNVAQVRTSLQLACQLVASVETENVISHPAKPGRRR
jgi:hypothetical protein